MELMSATNLRAVRGLSYRAQGLGLAWLAASVCALQAILTPQLSEVLENHLDFSRFEVPSGIPSDESLGIRPRCLRGCYTVNLYQVLVYENSLHFITLTVIEFVFIVKISELFKVDLVP